MTYRQIFFLRRRLGLDVEELVRKFPQHARQIRVTEWSQSSDHTLRRLSRKDPDLYAEVVACRRSLFDED